MNIYLWPLIKIIAGCILLGFGAERFISSSNGIARKLHLPAILVGVLIVGFGTSFPEMVVSFIASMKGASNMAIGNAIGSNILNVTLVLGVAALVSPIIINPSLIRREFIVLFIVMGFVAVLLMNHMLSRFDGVLLLIALIIYLSWTIISALRAAKRNPRVKPDEGAEVETRSWTPIMLYWFLGLGLLFVSSELLISGATVIARHLGVSDFIVGLTVVAIGTSLPELATTVVAAYKKHAEIAVGNVIGSNIFNLLAVMAMPALISPVKTPAHLMSRDYLWMTAVTILLFLFGSLPIFKSKIRRWQGGVLLGLFAAYMLVLIF